MIAKDKTDGFRKEKQVGGICPLTCDFVEPMSGLEPLTYALRVR